MKRYFVLAFALLALSACDDGSGGGGGAGGEAGDGGRSAESAGMAQPMAGGEAAAPNTASQGASFGNTVILGRPASQRFDESGNLVGVYAIPYVPSKGKK